MKQHLEPASMLAQVLPAAHPCAVPTRTVLCWPMDSKGREARAARRAERYAPMPTGGSLMAGICGAVVALIGSVAVAAFYGWQLRDHVLIAACVTSAGFLVGLVGYKRLARLNRRARLAELAQINHNETD